jgi:hypothetical protein
MSKPKCQMTIDEDLLKTVDKARKKLHTIHNVKLDLSIF